MAGLIVSDLEQHFQNLRKHRGAGLTKTALVDTKDLSTNIRRRMRKQASSASSRSFFSGINTMDLKMGNPSFYHPLFQPVNMMLPRDRRERNEWCRHFYRTEPIIATAIDLHTEYPISDFNNQCKDPAIQNFFDYMAFERLDIISLLLGIGHEYWKIGDVFPFGTLNESEGMWEKFTLLNPDYIYIQASVFADDAIIELIPDTQITQIVHEGPRGEYADIYNQLPDDVIRAVKMNKYIRMDSRNISHIAHKASDYEIWGTPLMMRCFKALIYKDKLRAAQDAIANRHIFPLRLAKLGTPGEPYPDQQDIQEFRDMLLAVDNDPYNYIVYHYGVNVDFIGSTGKILPLNTEFDFIQKELMIGLCINDAMLSGQSASAASAEASMNALAQRYMSYRYRLESFIRNKVYKPISKIQGFYEPSNGVKTGVYRRDKEKVKLAAKGDMQLIVPTIRWHRRDLTANQAAVTLLTTLVNRKLVSTRTVQETIGLDADIEKQYLEAERGTVLDPDAPKNGPLDESAPSSEDAFASRQRRLHTKLADFFQKGRDTESSSASSPERIKIKKVGEKK